MYAGGKKRNMQTNTRTMGNRKHDSKLELNMSDMQESTKN